MAELMIGAKAGIVAGLCYGIIAGVLNTVTYAVFWDSIDELIIHSGGPVTLTLSALIPMIFINAIIGGIIGGILFGLIYALLYKSLPGSSSVKKGIGLALIFWFILSVLFGYISVFYLGIAFYGVNVLFGFIAACIWGYLLGHYWEKYTISQPINTPSVE